MKNSKGWITIEFENVLNSIVGGGTPSKSIPSYYHGSIPWMSVKDMNTAILIDTVDHITQEAVDNSSTNIIPKGVPIIATRMSLGKVVVAEFDSAINQDLKALFHSSLVSREYLVYWYNSQSQLIESLGTGTTVKGIRLEVLRALQFSLSPFAEQKEIANQLDSLLAKVDSIKNRLDAIPDIIKRFRQSVLSSAVSGKLTESYRKEYKLQSSDVKTITIEQFNSGLTKGNFGKKNTISPVIQDEEIINCVSHIDGYPLIRVGAICDSVVPNRDKPKSFSGGYHWLLTPHFSEHSIYIDYKSIESGLSKEEVEKYNAKIIQKNNVIMTCVGRLGLSAILEENAVINQQLHAFIANEHILPEYLAYSIRANQNYYDTKATSTTIPYLNKTSCNSLPIPLPSIEEQKVIVQQVEQFFSLADSVERKVNEALERVNNLTQSILAKAFRGELTAEWRELNQALITGENSAEALLAKIKAEREALSKKKAPKKKTTARKAKT